MQVPVESLGPGRAVCRREIDIQRLEPVFIVNTIRKDLRARVRGANTRHIRQVMQVRWELMRKRREARRRSLEIGSLTITALPQPPQLLYALRNPCLPRPRLLVLLELLKKMKKRSFLFARHMILKEIRNMQQQRGIDIDHGRVEEHGKRGWVAVDGLLGAGEGEGGAVEVKFERPGEKEELQGLQEGGGGCAFAVDAEDVLENVGFLDVATEYGQVV